MADTYGNVSVANTATSILAENRRRTEVRLYNNGSNTIFLGFDSSVTTSNGYILKSDTEFKLSLDGGSWQERDGSLYTGAIQGIVASGTEDLRYIEFDDTEDT